AAGLAGITVGIAVGTGDYLALIWSALLAVGVLAFAHVLGLPVFSTRLIVVLALGVTAHMALAMTINLLAPGFGGGFVTGDDAAYYRLADHVARYIRGQPMQPDTGPPKWGGDYYLFGAFAYLEAGLFIVFGSDVRLPLLLNSAFAVATAAITCATAARLFGLRAGLI